MFVSIFRKRLMENVLSYIDRNTLEGLIEYKGQSRGGVTNEITDKELWNH